MKIRPVFFQRYGPNSGKMSYLGTLKNPFKRLWIQIQNRMTFKS